MEKMALSELSYFKNLEELTKETINCTGSKKDSHKEVRKWNTSAASGEVSTFFYAGYQLTILSLRTYEKVLFSLESNHAFLIFSLKENALMVSNHQNVAVQEGVILSQRNIYCELLKGKKVELLIFSFDKSFFKSKLWTGNSSKIFRAIFPNTNSFVFDLNTQVQKILWELIENNKKGDSEYLYINAKIYELLTEVYEIRYPIAVEKEEEEDKLLKVKNIIIKNIDNQYSIPDLAKIVGMNASYLKRNFKEVYNETIFEFANRKRMQQAQVLLVSTVLPIAIISEKVGYQHASHFSYAFKNSLGLTPNNYRSKHKQTETIKS